MSSSDHSHHSHDRAAARDQQPATVLLAYISEGMALLGEGVSAGLIESAGLAIGAAEGPLAAADRVSLALLDQALHAHDHAHDHAHGHAHAHDHGHDHAHDHGHDHAHDHAHDHGYDHGATDAPMPESAVYVLEKMAHGFSRLGGASGEGFYERIDGESALWPGLRVFARATRKVAEQDVQDRLRYAIALALMRVGEDAARSRPETSSIQRFVAVTGPGPFLHRANELAVTYGERFMPPEALPAWIQSA